MLATAGIPLLAAACSGSIGIPTTIPRSTAVETATVAPTPMPSPVATPNPTLASTFAPTPEPDFVVMAAGDIACDPMDPNFNSGMGTSTACRQRDTASLLTEADLILVLGDDQYECGGLAAYLASFDPSWGAFKSHIRPTIGNHERDTGERPTRIGTECDRPSSAGYYRYFGTAAPADRYSFDVAGWHFATLDSTCSPARCLAEASWLIGDLATHSTACTLVYYHHPRWSSGPQGGLVQRDPFWRAAVAAGVDVILNGHDHDYERFAPMDANGAASATGVREFVVGTGGFNHLALSTIQPNSEVRNGETFGVLKLTLHPDRYEWQFLPIAGQAFTDQGSSSCH